MYTFKIQMSTNISFKYVSFFKLNKFMSRALGKIFYTNMMTML